MKYNNIIFLGLCLGLTTYSALSADSVIKISGRVLDYGCTVSSDSLNFTVNLKKTVPDNFQRPVAQVQSSLFRLH